MTRRSLGWGLLLAVLLGTAWPALRPGSVQLADGEWAVAPEAAGPVETDRFWVWVAQTQAQVAPWQPGWPRAQRRLHRIGQQRRDALPHDRGGRRAASQDVVEGAGEG